MFKVGNEEYRVESSKKSLAEHSSVFNSMFFGKLKPKGKIIKVPDCKPEVFEYLLNHVDGRNLDFVKDIGHSLYIAEKYMLTDLKNVLIDYANVNLNYENCIDIYQASVFLSIIDIQSVAIPWLCSRAENVLTLPPLLDLSEDILLPFMSNENLHTGEELNLFKFVVSWIKFQGKSGLKLLDTIQLDRMSVEEIDSFVKPTKLFSFEKLYQALVQIEKLRLTRCAADQVIQETSNLAENNFGCNIVVPNSSETRLFVLGESFVIAKEERKIIFELKPMLYVKFLLKFVSTKDHLLILMNMS